jgi:protein O-mannosyl-transferase
MAGQKKYSQGKNKAKAAARPVAEIFESPASAQAQHRLKVTLGLIVCAFAFLLYVQSISFDYTLDDDAVTYNNTLVTKGISSIPSILQHSYWYGFDKTNMDAYRPASLVLFAIESQFFPGSSYVHHAVNVLLYAITCFLLFLLLCKLFEKQNLFFPLACTLLYAAHPLHTEVVNSIKSRDEILCLLFAICAALFLLKYVSKNSVPALLFAGLCFFISMLSKETGVTFFAALPLMLFVFTAATARKIITAAGVLGVFVLFYFIIRYQVLSSALVLKVTQIDNSLVTASDTLTRKATAFYMLLKYIFLLIFPYPLSHDYSFDQIKIREITDAGALLAIAIYAAAGIYSLRTIRNRNVVAFSILFFLFTIAPTSNLFVLIGATMAERFLYTPSLGYCILLCWLLFKLAKDVKHKTVSIQQFVKSNRLVFTLTILILFFYSFQTISRSRDWKNNISLFSNDVKVADRSARAHYNWGSALLFDVYESEKNKNRQNGILDKSIAELRKAVSIMPTYTDAHMNLGIAYLSREDYQNSILSFEAAKKLYPKPSAKLYNNLGMLYGRTGRFTEALSHLDSALTIDPELAVAHNNRGQALYGLGRFDEAMAEFQKAIDLKKDFAEAYRNIGGVYGSLKQYKKALDYLNEANKLNPGDVTILQFIGTTYQNMGDTIQAKIYFDQVQSVKQGQEM